MDGGLYVLAGRERFKKVDYSGIQDFRLRQRQYDAVHIYFHFLPQALLFSPCERECKVVSFP